MIPYVPSLKTDGKSDDRKLLDAAVEKAAIFIAENAKGNFDLLSEYSAVFDRVAADLHSLELSRGEALYASPVFSDLSKTIYGVAQKYEYQGAFLGELNYAITRLIQRVPQLKVERGEWPEKDELRYWLYAITVEALTEAHDKSRHYGVGIAGVFEDIKDEYKRRVNTSYEAAQIVKSGDCYDTPYYTRLVEVLDSDGKHLGYQEIMLKRSDETLNKDVLDDKVALVRSN